MLEPLGRALEPVPRSRRLLATSGRSDELALDPVALGQQRLQLLPVRLRASVAASRRSSADVAAPRPRPAPAARSAPYGADLPAQFLCPLRSRGLERERPQPLLDLGLEVARPLDVDRDPRELQLRPVTPALEASQPGRLLDELPPLLGLRAEDLLDAPLADDRAHRAAEPDVGEQLDEVRAAHRRAVDEVLPFPAAVQPPHERDLRKRQLGERAVLVVEEQLDLAVVGGRPVLAAREEHVVRLLGPELARRKAARGPEQRIGDVRLPGAVRPDDDGNPAFEANLDRLGERLEPAQLDGS